MLVRKPDDEGFGLVEVIIAFFLLAIIAMFMLPAVWNGIGSSARQSSVATATRAVNAQIEDLRDGPTCARLKSAAYPGVTVDDGQGRSIAIQGPGTPPAVPSCTDTTSKSAVSITLVARQGTTEPFRSTALIYLP